MADDKLFFPGARADDICAKNFEYHSPLSLHSDILWRKWSECLPKKGVLREAQSPGEVFWDFNEVCNSPLPRRVFVHACPLRLNGTDQRIKELNLLHEIPAAVEVIDLGNKMSSACVVCHDEVHLSELGITLLRSILKYKELRKLYSE